MSQICDMGLGERLGHLVEKRGISVRELAKRIGPVAPNTVGRWITEDGDPRLGEAIRLAEFFGVPLAYLALGESEPFPELTEDEKDVLRLYRDLRDERRLTDTEARKAMIRASRSPGDADGEQAVGRGGTLAPKPKRKGTG